MKQKFILILALIIAAFDSIGCTSAIVSPRMSRNARPILWKNRDTGTVDNFIAYVNAKDPGSLDYVALFNAGDSLLAEAWIGVNRAGFAIMNTASYNLAPDTATLKDREGYIMSEALKQCRSVADFEKMLAIIPKPMGVQANFGVIDRDGNGAYFETDDYSFTRYDVNEDSIGLILRTNYSLSGDSVSGFGYIREQNARYLLRNHIENALPVGPEIFTDTLSRSFYHSLIGHDMLSGDDEWIVDQDFIPRNSTSASVAIGYDNDGKPVMWTLLGYPPCSYTRKVTLDSIPTDMQPDSMTWRSPFCDEIMKLKDEVFPIKRGSGSHYMNAARLRHYNEYFRNKSLESYSE